MENLALNYMRFELKVAFRKASLHKMQTPSTSAPYNCGRVGNYSDDCYFPQTSIKMVQITISLAPFFSKFFPDNMTYQELGK